MSLGHIRAAFRGVKEIESRIERPHLTRAEHRWRDGALGVTALD